MEKASPRKDFAYDGLIWFFLICFLAMLSLSMLIRDSQKQYGAMSFGVFPAFTAVDPQNRNFDQHRLHGQLSTVIITSEPLPEDILAYLQRLSQVTAMGKKYLTSLIMTDRNPGVSNKSLQYLILSQEAYQKIQQWRTSLYKEGIILVDQNGVIRGIFNINDKMERLNFESAVKGIL